MSDHHDESLFDKAKRMLGMGGDEHDHHDHPHDEGHGVEADADAQAQAPGTSVADAGRTAPLDANEDPSLRRNEYMETGAASGQVAMPGGEEPVVGDEDRDTVDRRI